MSLLLCLLSWNIFSLHPVLPASSASFRSITFHLFILSLSHPTIICYISLDFSTDMAPTKPLLHPLKTPKTATFPSELHAGPSSRPDIKCEDASSTPISPPLAYTEFLKALTPAFSPMSPGMNFPKFPVDKSRTPISQPSTATSTSFPGREFSRSETLSPQSPVSARSFRDRRRLRISTTRASSKNLSPTTDSPLSALSASAAYSPFSPADWKLHYSGLPRSSTSKPVSVRQVVTRTVTYKRTPLEPAPRGKRRKTNSSH